MKIDLSQKRRYTFEQVAVQLGCSLADLRYFVFEGELVPSIFIQPGRYRAHQMCPAQDYGSTGYVYPSEMSDGPETNGLVQDAWLNDFLYLVLPIRINANQCEFRFVAPISGGFDIGDLIYELGASVILDDVMTDCVVMATELDRFKVVMSGRTKGPVSEKALATTERNTLLKLVVGMAVKGYAHDPASSKSTASKEIADDLASLDMKIDPDTVRKYLKQAAETVLPGKPPQA